MLCKFVSAAAGCAFLCAAAVVAQNTTVYANSVGGTANPAASATIYWQPTSAARISTSGGQILAPPETAAIANGVFTMSLPDALLATPNICYAVTAVDNSTGRVLLGGGLDQNGNVLASSGYRCVQPTGSTWNFDFYVPGTAVTVLPSSLFQSPLSVTTLESGAGATASIAQQTSGQYLISLGLPAGPQGPQGQPALLGQGMGAWSGTTTYAEGQVVTYGGNSYASATDANLDHEPDTSPADWYELVSLNNLPTAFAAQSVAGPDSAYFTVATAGGQILNSVDQTTAVSPQIWDKFDEYADGTVISNQPSPDGHSQWSVGGGQVPTVEGGYLVPVGSASSSSFYAFLSNTATPSGAAQPVTEVGGSFRWCPPDDGNPYNPAEVGPAIIAAQDGSLSNMLHLNMSATAWTLEKRLGGASPPWPQLATGSLHLLPNCTTDYTAKMLVNVAAGTVQVIPPSGNPSPVIVDSDITTIAPNSGAWESEVSNTGGQNEGGGVAEWGQVWLGRSDADKEVGASAAANAAVSALEGYQGTWSYVYPDGVGPTFQFTGGAGNYEVATGAPLTQYVLQGYFNVTATTDLYRQNFVIYVDESNGTPSASIVANTISLGGFAIIDSVTPSNDGNGNLSLIFHQAVGGTVTLSMTGTGDFTPATVYPVGATPLANSLTYLLTNSAPAFKSTTQAAAGWYTIAQNNTGYGNSPLTAHLIFTATDLQNTENIDVNTVGYATDGVGGCSIATAQSAGAAPGLYPLNAVRCSWVAPSGATANITASGGVITSGTLSGGTNYIVGADVFVVQGSSDSALFVVTSIGSGGAVTGATLAAGGTGYTTASGVATATAGLVDLDVYQADAYATTITAAQGVSLGAWTVVSSPTVGATALAGGSTGTVALAAPGASAFTLTTTGSSGAATYSGGVLNIPQYAGGGSMTWPSGSSAGIPNYSGSSSWGSTYNASNLIPANFISTLNQSTTGNAATATALAATPTQCSSGDYSTGIAAAGTANCAQVAYSQLSGTPTSLAPSGTASGDLSGSYPGPTVAQVNGAAVPASASGLSSNSSSQLVAQTAHNQSTIAACTTTNSSNAYSCTTSPSFTPAAGDQVLVKFNAANTGSATLNVNSAGAEAIYKWGNTATLASGDIQASHYIRATYDGSHWQLEGQIGNSYLSGGAANDIPYQTAAGTTSYIAPVDSAVLVTSASGVPSESTTLPSGLAATNMTLTTPALGTPSAVVLTNASGTCATCVASNTTSVTDAWTTTGPTAVTSSTSGTLFTSASGSGHMYNLCVSIATTTAGTGTAVNSISTGTTVGGHAGTNQLGGVTESNATPGYNWSGQLAAGMCGLIFPDSSTAVTYAVSLDTGGTHVEWSASWELLK